MNVEIGVEVAQVPEKEYMNGIAVAVQQRFEWFPCLGDFSLDGLHY
jgi:hypothetical protein